MIVGVILSNTWYVGEYDPTLKEPNEVFENSPQLFSQRVVAWPWPTLSCIHFRKHDNNVYHLAHRGTNFLRTYS